jgi:hypothetical protein
MADRVETAEQTYGPKECGSCRLWRPILEDDRGPIGPCRLTVRIGDFPGTAPICERYLARDAAIPKTPPRIPSRRSPSPRPPVVHSAQAYTSAPAELPPLPEELLDMTREEFAQAIREALREELPEVSLAPKWEGGTVILKPRDASIQSKELPLDALFHKVIMVRDRLRVLEQRVNGHEKLSDAEKIEMQAYITKCYGSLTTFNVLFRDEKDKFVGDRS